MGWRASGNTKSEQSVSLVVCILENWPAPTSISDDPSIVLLPQMPTYKNDCGVKVRPLLASEPCYGIEPPPLQHVSEQKSSHLNAKPLKALMPHQPSVHILDRNMIYIVLVLHASVTYHRIDHVWRACQI